MLSNTISGRCERSSSWRTVSCVVYYVLCLVLLLCLSTQDFKRCGHELQRAAPTRLCFQLLCLPFRPLPYLTCPLPGLPPTHFPFQKHNPADNWGFRFGSRRGR